MTRFPALLLTLTTALSLALPAGAVPHRIGVSAAAGVLGDRSIAGVEAAALLRLRGRFVLDVQLDAHAWWEDVAGELGRTSPFVVGGQGIRGRIGGGIALLAPESPSQLYATLGVGPTVWRVAEGDRTDLVAEADGWTSRADPAGWLSLTPYLRFTFEIRATELVSLIGLYEFAVDRQLSAITPPEDASQAWLPPAKVREPHLTQLQHRLRLGIAIRPEGSVGFALAVEPALTHGFVDRADADDLDTSRILPMHPGVAFHVGAWIAF
ncbi:MAG: hypothetical protein QGH45_14965 [Myxococcota bacterium]|nr:hypothetical protein [Myxococcota bacterium]